MSVFHVKCPLLLPDFNQNWLVENFQTKSTKTFHGKVVLVVLQAFRYTGKALGDCNMRYARLCVH
jgi:hypothetical protein